MPSMNEIINSPILWLVVWIALCVGRDQLHIAIRSLIRIFHSGLRLTSHSVLRAEKRLVNRNKEVLMADGLEDAERSIERKFERINIAVERDLAKYPSIQRKLSEIVAKLEEDYKESTDVPPELPNWVTIIEAISNIKHTGDSLVSNMLGEIKVTLEAQHKKSIQAYEGSMRKRHSLLSKMMPAWRKVKKIFEDVGRSVTDLNTRSKTVDRFMDEYEQIRNGTDEAMRKVSSSSMTQFFIAGLAMAIAVGGAVINFQLIARPMSEMVGGAGLIWDYKTSEVAAMVIILLELSMGLFLMESLRITRLFPIIGSMDDRKRKWMIFISLFLLTVLAGIESSLAFMRDRLAEGDEAFRLSMAGIERSKQSLSMIPMIGQMVMGFIFPFVLAFVAIPLESFVKSSRTVLGVVTAGLLRIIAFLLRLLGNILLHIGNFIIKLSDLITFPRLFIDWYISRDSDGETKKVRTPKRRSDKTVVAEDDMGLQEDAA